MEFHEENNALALEVGQLKRRIKMMNLWGIILLVIVILLNSFIVYLQFSKFDSITDTVNQQSARLDDISTTLSHINDNNVGVSTAVGNLKQDIATVINMVRDDRAATTQVGQPIASATRLTLHVQFTCTDDASSKTVTPCPIVGKILETQSTDDFSVDAGQTMVVEPVRVRLSISATVPGYQPYSNIFEYTETGQNYPVEIRLKK